jgi:hypothetical protein
MSEAHNELVALAYLSKGKNQTDALVNVHWNSSASAIGENEIVLTGTLTVTAALTAAYTYFVLSGVTFDVKSGSSGTTVNFSYSGAQSADKIKALFKAGAQLIFGGAK